MHVIGIMGVCRGPGCLALLQTNVGAHAAARRFGDLRNGRQNLLDARVIKFRVLGF